MLLALFEFELSLQYVRSLLSSDEVDFWKFTFVFLGSFPFLFFCSLVCLWFWITSLINAIALLPLFSVLFLFCSGLAPVAWLAELSLFVHRLRLQQVKTGLTVQIQNAMKL